MRPLLIVNPQSSGGKTGKIFDGMLAPIRRILGEVDVARTERARHAVDLAREAALDGRETVVAVGGDGSIHEVVNGLMQARDRGATGTRLGIIGAGTGGDLCRTLKLNRRLDRFCTAIASGSARPLDVGRISYETHGGERAEAFFINVLSAGMGGLVDQIVSQTSRALGNTLAYTMASLRGLVRSRVGRVRCVAALRGETRELELATRNVAICNGRFFGSGMQVAPMARADDGVFDVIDLGGAPPVRFAAVSTGMYTGSHIRHPDVRHFQCDRIELTLLNRDVEPVFLLDVDGEPLGRLPLTVTLEPRAIQVLAPAD
ncbi:diacylglycerol/lipid kinase family protein [Sorangium sp. So ce131]|uniref:diacylglycerol/lipid kinase family protein n=1 Tax=Sorangium sp. So ce131 TaxID=3133282 RepID=UPI003F61D6A9